MIQRTLFQSLPSPRRERIIALIRREQMKRQPQASRIRIYMRALESASC